MDNRFILSDSIQLKVSPLENADYKGHNRFIELKGLLPCLFLINICSSHYALD